MDYQATPAAVRPNDLLGPRCVECGGHVQWRCPACAIRSQSAPLFTQDELAAAVAAERERCAKLCEQVAAWLCRDGLREQAFGAFDCAGNIRLRGWPNGEVSR